MGLVKRAADLAYTFRFIRLMAMDWKSWDAYKLGIIDTTWEEDMDGRIALLEAADAMNKAKIENLKFSEMDIVKSIEKYNYVDVKVIDDIITFLRTKI